MKEQLQRAKQALEAEPAPAASSADAAPAPADGAVDKKAQARAKKADDYHARHKSWVAQFNELTGGECAGGEAGVKWAAVRAWQQKHWQLNNLLADGLVGPKTLEAAKLLQKKSAPKKEGAEEKDTAGEKEHAAGNAEGAEASAGKPNLDAEDADAQLEGPATSSSAEKKPQQSKQVSLGEFQQQLQLIETLLAQFKPPQGRGPRKSVAEDMMAGKGDAGAPDPTGAMMSGLDSYLGETSKLVDRWGTLDLQARADFLLHAINKVLARELVPEIGTAHPGTPDGTGASFDAVKWMLNVDGEQFDRNKFEDNHAKRKHIDGLASTVFHEGRHAEQRFSVARLLVRKGEHDASKISEQAHVREDIAAAAIKIEARHKHPVSAAENQSAERMAGDIVGPAGDEHIAIEHLIPKIGKAGTDAATMFHQLSPEHQQTVTATWHDYRARMIVALDAYYQLPTEQDAFAAEKKLDDKMK